MEINLKTTPFDLDFHPSSPLVATGLINGVVQLYSYPTDAPEDAQSQRVLRVKAHKESCRAVRFVNSGQVLLSGSSDCSILATDTETGTAIARLENAHAESVNRLVNLTETTIASGDDKGCIKVWDTRNRVCCNTFEAHEDFISDMTFVSGSSQLLATSGDGKLSVCSLRKNMVQWISEYSEDEPLSLVTMKNGKKVVCGTQSGALLLYSWGFFKDCSDRFIGHPPQVETLLQLDEDTLISGAEDGIIRLVSILPNKIVGPLAEHSEYPIEGLAFSHDRKILGSISHDMTLKLWQLEELLGDHQNSSNKNKEEKEVGSDAEEMDVDLQSSNPSEGSDSKRKRKITSHPSKASTSDFFADL